MYRKRNREFRFRDSRVKIRARNLLAAWTNDPGCTPRKLQVPHVWCGEEAFDLGVKLTAGQAQFLWETPLPPVCTVTQRNALALSSVS